MTHPFARQYTALPSDPSPARHRRRLRVEPLEEIAAANSLQDLLLIGSLGEVGAIAPTPPGNDETRESETPPIAAAEARSGTAPPLQLPPSAEPSAPVEHVSGATLPPSIAIDPAEADLWLIGTEESGDHARAEAPATNSTVGKGSGTGGGEAPSGLPVTDQATFDAGVTPVAGASTAPPGSDLSLSSPPTALPTSEVLGAAAPTGPGDRVSIRSAAGDATITLDANGDRLESVFTTQAPAASAPGAALPYGLIGFRVTDVELGGIATVDLTLPTSATVDGYYKQDPHTQSLSRFDFDGQTGAIVSGNTVTLYLQDGGRGDDDGVINGVVVDPGGPGYEVIMSATVREVTFSGPDLINIVADPGTPAYPSPPHWLDTNLNGTIDLEGERALPVGYPRDRNSVVSARFSATITNVPYPMPQNFMVRGHNTLSAIQPYNYTIPATPVIREGNDLYLPPTTVYNPFPSTVNYGSVVIIWEFSFSGGSSWYPAGRTENELYVTLDTPVGGPVWHTPLHIGQGKAAAVAAITHAQVITATMEAFETREVKARHINPALNEKPLHYYKNWDTANVNFTGIISDPELDGQCGAFADLFAVALRRKGVTNPMDIVGVAPTRVGEKMFIDTWSFAAEGTSGEPTHPFQNEFVDPNGPYVRKNAGVWEYYWGTPAEVNDFVGVGGQNTTNPASIFNNHQVVEIGTKIYDPSYGTKFDSLQEWEDESVEGFGVFLPERAVIRRNFAGLDTQVISRIPIPLL